MTKSTVGPSIMVSEHLQDVIERINDYEDDLTIHVAPERMHHSKVLLAPEPDSGGLPAQAKDAGMTYFIEVFVTKELVRSLEQLDPFARTNRVIQYAIDDA
jgi:hypothetical protein